MPDFRLIIDIKDVAEGDATSLAQAIWDENAESFDASLGDFQVSVQKVSDGAATFDTGWEPVDG